MKKVFLFIGLLISLGISAQTYNPTQGTVSNKPYSPGQGVPTDSRSMFYDPVYGLWRDYASTAEVVAYLDLAKYRMGGFDIFVRTGGSLSGGIWTGGVRSVYWFKDGTANANLVLKYQIVSVNGQTGIVVTKNADSLLGKPVDTGAVARNNYYISYDSVNKKFILIQPALGYVPGDGVDINGNVISAQNTAAIWNANQLRGRSITSATPVVGNTIVWNGTQWIYSTSGGGTGSIVSGYVSSDTLYLVSASDTVAIPGIGGASTDSSSWRLTGNSVTDNNWFLGTTNSKALQFRTNNVERMRVDSAGKLGVGIVPIAGQVEVYNTNTSGQLSGLYITHSSTTTDPTSDYGTIQINNIDNTTNNLSSLIFGGTDQHTSGIFNVNVNPASNYAALGFYTNGAGGFTEKIHVYDDAKVQVNGRFLATLPSGYTVSYSMSDLNDSQFVTKGMVNGISKAPADLDVTVMASGGTINNGTTSFVIAQQVGWRVRFYRNYAAQSVSASQPTYYSFDNTTGTYTFYPALVTGETVQFQAY